MIRPQPVMSRLAWLVLGVSVLVFAGILALAAIRDHRPTGTGRHVAAATTAKGIDLKSVLSLRQETNGALVVVALITVQNNTDQPVMYVGASCYAPAQASFVSTLQPPAGPTYSPSAAVLRAHVMDDQRQFDQLGYFTVDHLNKSGHIADLEPCDESAPPMLPPQRTITYSMSQFVGTAQQPDVDAFTTDVVTTLRLGSLPATWPGRFPPPIQVVDTIQVRTPLRTITNLTRASMADYPEASRHFDLLMSEARIAAWVDQQDPTLWRTARLRPSYRTTGPTWTLEAFNHDWATPLVGEGTESAVTMLQIPNERWQSAPSTDAVLPPDASMADNLDLLYRDLYVGDLVLPSGKVMVGDSVASDNEVLFDYGLRPGSYSIHIVTAKPIYRTEEYESVAWEELILTDRAVTHWQPAVPVGHSIKELKPGELFSFGTDGGGGGFASPEAMKYQDTALMTMDDPLLTPLSERLEANDWLWGMTTVDPKTGANVFVTTTGGDGGFPILVGLDAQNRPAVLLADFGLLHMTYSGIKI